MNTLHVYSIEFYNKKSKNIQLVAFIQEDNQVN